MSKAAAADRKRTWNARAWTVTCLLALLAFGAWGVVVGRIHHPTKFWNFGYIHGGSLCLQDGCDPFDSRALDAVGPRHGEAARPRLNPEYPVYPPSMLLLAVPLNPFGWPGAGFAFFGLSLLAYGAAIVAMVRAVRFGPWVAGSIVLLALVSSYSPWLGLYYGNPVLVCAGLMTLACVLLLARERRHDVAAIVLLGMALCVKPQLAIGAVIFFLCRRDTRRAAAWAVVLFVAFSVVATVVYAVRLGGFAYLRTESRILALGFQRGHSSDGSLQNPAAFRFLNLEPLMSGISLGSKAAKGAALAVTVLCGALLWHVGRGGAALKRRPWTMLSLVLLLSFMPLYHREYDRCLLLALAPAAMEAEEHREPRWLGWLIAGVAVVWFWSEPEIPKLLPSTYGWPVNAGLMVVLFGLLLWSVWRVGRESDAKDAKGARRRIWRAGPRDSELASG